MKFRDWPDLQLAVQGRARTNFSPESYRFFLSHEMIVSTRSHRCGGRGSSWWVQEHGNDWYYPERGNDWEWTQHEHDEASAQEHVHDEPSDLLFEKIFWGKDYGLPDWSTGRRCRLVPRSSPAFINPEPNPLPLFPPPVPSYKPSPNQFKLRDRNHLSSNRPKQT